MYVTLLFDVTCGVGSQAILGRKFVVQDMHKLMYKIAQLSVTSDSDTTRQQCRQVPIHTYTHFPDPHAN